MATYSNNSPWAKTKQTWYLGYTVTAYMSRSEGDESYTIPPQYNEQPWRLAKELYGSEELYYIFALLNPDLIQDPVYDFSTGKVILIPTPARVRQYLQSNRSL